MFSLMAAAAPAMPVSVQGLSWSGAGIWTGVVLLVAAIVKAWPHLRKLSNESDASLRHDLIGRIDKLELQLSDERRECDKQMSALHVEIRGMRGEIDGLVRQLIAYQVAEARSGTAMLSPQMQRAVESLESIARDKAEKEGEAS